MPEIKVQHVVSCSSEDKSHPADNLLRPEGTHKWKCATAGEKSVSIVLQFEKSSQIHSIDIGNEGSAFIEILVGRATASSDTDYQVLLVASTFMTPLEARNGTNRTSVRMFGSSKLSATSVNEKWDRVKIVCTQPFNKTSTYGLSFIKFHSPSDPADKESPKTAQKNLGFFKIKSEEDEGVKTGSLFSHRGKVESPAPVSGAAAARAASRLAEEARSKPSTSAPAPSSSSSTTSKHTPSKTEEPRQQKKVEIKTKEKVPPTASQNREKRKHGLSDDDDTDEEEVVKTPLRKQSTSLSSIASKDSGKGDKPPPMKKTKSEPPKKTPEKMFSKLMEKVVFVMSGFQNPYRAELRDRAQAMGAVYKPDWGKGCTHLICAFVNTPKYNQVEGRGRIVSKKWIFDCHKQKKLLPWRNYRLGDAESPDEESDPEGFDDVDEYKPPAKTTPKKTPAASQEKQVKKPTPKKKYADSDDGGATDSGEDTEDEIRRIKEKQQKKKTKNKEEKSDVKPGTSGEGDGAEDADPYGADTDEDVNSSTSAAPQPDEDYDSGLPELPDFFTDKTFFLYGDMAATERRLLTRYITAYNGELEEYMNDKIKYVVTSSKWDDHFEDALSDNPNLVFVKPKWVYACHDKCKLVPHQPFIVVPDS